MRTKLVALPQPQLKQIQTSLNSHGNVDFYADIHGQRKVVYEVTPDGVVYEKNGRTRERGKSRPFTQRYDEFKHNIARSNLNGVLSLFTPQNMETSVSSDYKAVRGWIFVHDIGWNMANYAQGAAIALALGVNPIWGGVAMATYNLIKEKFCQATGFFDAMMVHHADRNPRPWMLAGEIIDTSGIFVESLAASMSMIPGALLPITLTGAFIRVFGGSMKGTAMVYVDPRMAISGNLGELQRKNGNQGFVSSLIGSGLGLLGVELIRHWGLGLFSPPLVVLMGAAFSIYAMTKMVKNLNYHPVNEKALRQVVGYLEINAQVPGPDKSTLKTLSAVTKADTIKLGAELRPLLADFTRVNELKKFYQAENYLLEVKGGKSIIVLRENCTRLDRVKALIHAIYVDLLKESKAYKIIREQKGQEFANLWLIYASYKKTPKDPEQFLQQMEAVGWSTDMLRFRDSGNRAVWGNPRVNLPERI